MLEKYEIVSAMFYGFDYRKGLTESPQERLTALAGAIEWVLDMQQRESARESTDDGKKRAHRRFNDAVLALSRAFALAAASDEARDIRDEVGFFQTVRAALAKSAPGSGKSSAERDLAVQQIVSRAVVSTEIVDILKAAGLDMPDISILSDEFLVEIQGMEKKNLALEALRKLINGELRSQSPVNVVQTRACSQRLEEAIARYHSNAITTAEVIQELIGLAKDIRSTVASVALSTSLTTTRPAAEMHSFRYSRTSSLDVKVTTARHGPPSRMISVSAIVVFEVDVDGNRSSVGSVPMSCRRRVVFPAPVVPSNRTCR